MGRPVLNLAGTTVGGFMVVRQVAGPDRRRLWVCRCNACGSERAVPADYLGKLRRSGKGLPCDTCSGRATRCGRCGKRGHCTGECKPSTERICELCCSLPHRVAGLRCKRCRLRYEPEQLEGIDYGARHPSALARLMGGGG